MLGVTPLRSYHGTSLMSCDRMSAGGGHREDCRAGELEEREEGTGRQGEKEGEVKERKTWRMSVPILPAPRRKQDQNLEKEKGIIKGRATEK